MRPGRAKPTRPRLLVAGLGRLLLAIGCIVTHGPLTTQAAENPAPAPTPLRVGISQAFLRHVNVNDAKAAFRILLESWAPKVGHPYSAEVLVLEDTRAFETEHRKSPLHLTILDSWQYLEARFPPTLRPRFVIAEGGRVGRRFQLLTHRDSPFASLPALQGAKLNRLRIASSALACQWLDSTLAEHGLPPATTFFRDIDTISKPTTTVLPVFFGKRDACIVDHFAFDLLKELNPQLGEKLRVVTESDLYADVLICVSDIGWFTPNDLPFTVDAVRDLGASPGGRQLMTLFKIDGTLPFEPRHLDTIRALRDRTTTNAPNHGQPPPP